MKRWMFTIGLAIVLFVSLAHMVTQAPESGDRVEPSTAHSSRSTQTHNPTTVTPSNLLPPPVNAEVDAERLFQHLEALNFERSRADDRTRTREYLLQTLTQYGWKPELQSFEQGANVVARRSGTEATSGTILVAAHFDTVAGSPGADDNASSVATVLEIARLLGPHQTLRSLHLAFFDQEEVGLLGSFAFTAKPENLTDLSGMVNLEMLGYACYTPGCQKYPEGLPIKPPTDRGDFLGVIGDQEHLPLLAAFQPDNSTSGSAGSVNLPPMITLPIPFKGLLTPDVLRSDHAPFWAKNIGAVMVGDTANFRNPHYHQPSDTPATLDPDFFAGSAQRVVNAVTKLLNSSEPLTTVNSP